MEASNHSIINHQGAGSLYQKTEDGQLVCPFASNLNCAATFGKPQQIRKHVSSIHQGLKLPCPVVTEKGCKGTFSGWTCLRNHLVRSHRPPRYVCPRPNCTIAFTSSNAVRDHVRIVHEKTRVPCPLADEYDCDRSFATKEYARRHAKEHHKDKRRYPCPLAEETNYKSDFSSKRAAERHASAIHQKIRIPCPAADEYDCPKTFSFLNTAQQHVIKAHNKVRYPCPLADEHNCPKTFTTKQGAKRHSALHSGIKFTCPVATEYKCDSVFSSKEMAKRHARIHTHRFICPRTGCEKRFLSFTDALQHAVDRDHRVIKLFLCPVQTCASATIGLPLTTKGVKKHQKLHVSHCHIDESADFIPQPASQLPLHSDLPLYSLIFQHEGFDPANEFRHNESSPGICDTDSDSDYEVGIEDISNASDSYGELQEGFFPEEEELHEFASGILSEEHRLRVLQQNTAVWSMSHLLLAPRVIKD